MSDNHALPMVPSRRREIPFNMAGMSRFLTLSLRLQLATNHNPWLFLNRGAKQGVIVLFLLLKTGEGASRKNSFLCSNNFTVSDRHWGSTTCRCSLISMNIFFGSLSSCLPDSWASHPGKPGCVRLGVSFFGPFFLDVKRV